MSEDYNKNKLLFAMDIKDVAGLSEPLKRVIDCLDKGISSLMHPFAYKRAERAKMLIEQERSDKNAIIALKEAMTQDMIEVARTSRDRNELHNISEIYGQALAELQSFDSSKLPAQLPSDDWAAHFYDCAKDCSDDKIRILWSKILAGEIIEPGTYYKRTLTNLKQIEKHEAEWFVDLSKYIIDNSMIPEFVLRQDLFPFNKFQSLVDCGFVNANDGSVELKIDTVMPLKGKNLSIRIKDRSYYMHVRTLTDTGYQIYDLINIQTDDDFANKLIEEINKSEVASASLIQ